MPTFTVAGQRVRSSSQRRYVAFRVERNFNGGTMSYEGVKRVEIFKRSDSVRALDVLIGRQGFHSSRYFVIVDQTTGEEVHA